MFVCISGADELFPVMTYVIIKANVPFIYSEIMQVQDFMHEIVANGEAGYMAVTVQTCLSFLQCLDIQQVRFQLF